MTDRAALELATAIAKASAELLALVEQRKHAALAGSPVTPSESIALKNLAESALGLAVLASPQKSKENT
jgi:hypothetical protein